MINRTEINRALAKAIAYKQCGKHASAELWAARLLGLLQCSDILRDEGLRNVAVNGFTDADETQPCMDAKYGKRSI